MPPKLVELLSIAFNTSYTHKYAPGTRRHIKAALRHGATIAEIVEVLKLCVVQGVQASISACRFWRISLPIVLPEEPIVADPLVNTPRRKQLLSLKE
jgi:hypothetical protein